MALEETDPWRLENAVPEKPITTEGKCMKETERTTRSSLVRRSKLFVPVNREEFVEKAWTREADCIILDLEDSIAPGEKASARKLVKDVIPIVSRGGVDIQVRINRAFQEEDLDAVIMEGLAAVMIPGSESAEDIQHIDRMVTQMEQERGIPRGKIEFDLIIETARGIINVETIANSCPRIVQINLGQADLSVDMGFSRSMEITFEQYSYAESRLLYAARAAGVQCCGLGAQNNIDFRNITLSQEHMIDACRHAFRTGYSGAMLVHPGWVRAANEGYAPSQRDLDQARYLKQVLEEAHAEGKGSVSVNGRMYDVADIRYVNSIVERGDAIAMREREKTDAMQTMGGVPL